MPATRTEPRGAESRRVARLAAGALLLCSMPVAAATLHYTTDVLRTRAWTSLDAGYERSGPYLTYEGQHFGVVGAPPYYEPPSAFVSMGWANVDHDGKNLGAAANGCLCNGVPSSAEASARWLLEFVVQGGDATYLGRHYSYIGFDQWYPDRGTRNVTLYDLTAGTSFGAESLVRLTDGHSYRLVMEAISVGRPDAPGQSITVGAVFGNATFARVPEPATWLLFGAALSGAAAVVRRRRA